MTNRTFFDHLPNIYPVGEDDLWRVIGDTTQRAFDRSSAEAQAAIDANYLEQAEDELLTEYGRRFQTIGKRRGRGEEEYRRFLRGIVIAYQGRGRKQDIRSAVAAGLLVDNSTYEEGGPIEFTPHPETLEYELTIHDHAWASHPPELVPELAEYADASVVELRTPVEYRHRKDPVRYGNGGRQARQTRAVSPAVYGSGDRIIQTSRYGGFGAGRFDGQDKFGAGEFGDDERGGSQYGDLEYGQGTYGE